MTVTGKLQPTLAGWWLGCVSLPFVQFILLRWYFRLLIWTRFLWQVSRIDLRLVAIHPDRAGGLGFLSTVTYAFAPLLPGQGVLLAGVMANKIFYAGAKLTDFKLELLVMVTMMLFFVLAPLLVFTPRLARTKRIGLAEYGGLAQRYVREFDQKWLRGGAPPDEPLVGSVDIQSLADLGNSFEIVKGMKPVPFGKDTLLQLAVISLAPVAPLGLPWTTHNYTIFPAPAESENVPGRRISQKWPCSPAASAASAASRACANAAIIPPAIYLTMIPLGELLDRFLHVVF
jgi:hypothetical protein